MQLKTKGVIDLQGGINFTQDVTLSFAGKFKDKMQLEVMGQQVGIATVYDGTKGWIKVNDAVTDMDENLLELMKDAMYTLRVTQQVFLLKGQGLRAVTVGRGEGE